MVERKTLLVAMGLTAAITRLLAEDPKALGSGTVGDSPFHVGTVNPWADAPKMPKYLMRKDPKHKARL